jgi:hypothetical protein
MKQIDKKKRIKAISQWLVWLAAALFFDFLLLFAAETTLPGIVTKVFSINWLLVGGLSALMGAWILNQERNRKHIKQTILTGLATLTLGLAALALEMGLWGLGWKENILYFGLTVLIGASFLREFRGFEEEETNIRLKN